jgi:hypothetical protein
MWGLFKASELPFKIPLMEKAIMLSRLMLVAASAVPEFAIRAFHDEIPRLGPCSAEKSR